MTTSTHIENDPSVLFKRWFDDPMALLEKELKNGDGGTMGLMVALPLYERYIYVLTQQDPKGRKKYEVVADDLQLATTDEAVEFWTTFRHGFCHSGMPFDKDKTQQPLPRVWMDGGSSWNPKFVVKNGKRYIQLDPWKFIRRVMGIYRNDPGLLTQHPDAPLMGIHTMFVEQ
jgi:hypothetical protein